MGHAVRFLDEHLGYRTPKYVDVRDWRLGLAHRALQLAGLGYIFLWTILYKCHHLKQVPVSGYSRVDISTPVKNGCFEADASCKLDLRPFIDLPYCLQGKSMPSPDQKHCEYRDAYALSPTSPTPNALFVPFFVNRMFQYQGCRPSDENGWSCDQTFVTESDADGIWQHNAFIADVERYRLLISHSYEAIDEEGTMLMGRSQNTEGALSPNWARGAPRVVGVPTAAAARFRHHLAGEPVDVDIPGNEGANPDFASLSHSPWGDEMSVGDLIKLADPRGPEVVLATKGEEGLTRRERGGVLSVSIEYTNACSFDVFGLAEPHYVLSARLLPMQWFYQSHAVPHTDHRRHIEAFQGMLVTAHVHGSLRRFDPLRLLQVLATSLVLMAIAGVITDALMVHCTDLAKQYQLLRREPSPQVRQLRSAVAKLREEQELVRTAPSREGGSNVAVGSGSFLTAHEGLLAVLERIEQRLDSLDSGDGHLAREDATDLAGARLEELASELVSGGSVRVAPL